MAILLKLFNAAEKIPNQLVAMVDLPGHLPRSWYEHRQVAAPAPAPSRCIGHHHASRGQSYANTTSPGAEHEKKLVHGNFKRGCGGIYCAIDHPHTLAVPAAADAVGTLATVPFEAWVA